MEEKNLIHKYLNKLLQLYNLQDLYYRLNPNATDSDFNRDYLNFKKEVGA